MIEKTTAEEIEKIAAEKAHASHKDFGDGYKRAYALNIINRLINSGERGENSKQFARIFNATYNAVFLDAETNVSGNQLLTNADFVRKQAKKLEELIGSKKAARLAREFDRKIVVLSLPLDKLQYSGKPITPELHAKLTALIGLRLKVRSFGKQFK